MDTKTARPTIHDLGRSTWLASATLRASVLTLAMKNGGVMVYGGVQPRVLANMLRAKSPGAYYRKHISGRYPLLSSIPGRAPESPTQPDLEEQLRASLRMHGVEA